MTGSPRFFKMFLALAAFCLLLAAPAWAASSQYDLYNQDPSLQMNQYKTGGLASLGLDQITYQDCPYQIGTQGFFDWFDDLFGWFDDAKEDIEEHYQDYNDDGIPSSAFTWSRYGMNLHNLQSLSVDQYERVLNYTGPWIRFSMHTDEVAEDNWNFRLTPGLRNIQAAADRLGITPKITIALTGYSNQSSGDDYLLKDISWEEKADRYYNLAKKLTEKVVSLGFGDAIIEAWNEPDNPAGDVGIGLGVGDSQFQSAMTGMLNSFSAGVHDAGGKTAFSPFMSINDSKYDTIKSLWESTHQGFDYFSAHVYDDDPGKARYWAEQVVSFTADRPVIISEHGYQNHLKDATYYRRQAWGLEQGFKFNGQTTLQGIMGYVYGSDHDPWVISDEEDFFWKVTHDTKP